MANKTYTFTYGWIMGRSKPFVLVCCWRWQWVPGAGWAVLNLSTAPTKKRN